MKQRPQRALLKQKILHKGSCLLKWIFTSKVDCSQTCMRGWGGRGEVAATLALVVDAECVDLTLAGEHHAVRLAQHDALHCHVLQLAHQTWYRCRIDMRVRFIQELCLTTIHASFLQQSNSKSISWYSVGKDFCLPPPPIHYSVDVKNIDPIFESVPTPQLNTNPSFPKKTNTKKSHFIHWTFLCMPVSSSRKIK